MATHDAQGAAFQDLKARPGFLIRRLHQIHLALFAEECAAFDVTPVQYSIMSVLAAQPGLEQARLGDEVGVDRATLANVVGRLERRGLLTRCRSPHDVRRKLVTLTSGGRAVLARMAESAGRAHARTIDSLPAAERARFLAALACLVEAGNEHGRAFLRLS